MTLPAEVDHTPHTPGRTAFHDGRPRLLEFHGPRPPAFTDSDRKPTDLDLDNRRARALDLRAQQLTLRQIGLILHADPTMNTDPSYQGGFRGGYGWKRYRRGEPPLSGNALELAVSRDVSQAITRSRIALEESRQEAIALMQHRYEQAAAALWPKVTRGEVRPHEVWLQNLRDQRALLGLDPNPTVDVNLNGRIVVESPQPVFDADGWEKFAEALVTVGAVQPGDPNPLAALDPPDDIVDAEVVAETAPDGA